MPDGEIAAGRKVQAKEGELVPVLRALAERFARAPARPDGTGARYVSSGGRPVKGKVAG